MRSVLVASILVVQAFRPASDAVQAFRPALSQPALSQPALSQLGLGRAPTADEIKSAAVLPDGRGLPPGSGSAERGRDLYVRQCVACHGATGKEGPADLLVGGTGTLTTARPLKTVGSFWPYAVTLWDYLNRAMPYDRPGSLTPDDVYSVTAYVLFLNGIVGERDNLTQETLPRVQMPNREGFVR